MFRALILDWSGTLVDDSAPTLAATNAVLAQYDRQPMTWEEFRESFRLPYSEWYAEHVPGISLKELEEHFRVAFDSSEHPVIPLAGTAEFLQWCSENCIRLFVLTSMNTDNFSQQLREFGFDRHFEQTYSGVIDKRTVIGEIIAEHGLDLAKTAYVGDMAHDIETAHDGGVTAIGVLSGYDPASQLAAAGPHFLLSCIKSVHALLQGSFPEARCACGESIVIRRLAVSCFIGVPEEERAERQTLHLTVEIVPERNFASLCDRLELTVDYDKVARYIGELAGERPRKLIETLADEVARMILKEFSAREVSVEIEKDILPETEAVLVRTRRMRKPSAG
ncbi:MAG: HAD hydrolase-like protein [Verrucomicrobiota bacterium]|nr:HAD hydrolase-like protein [Verrucomicrobiota bacterium]